MIEPRIESQKRNLKLENIPELELTFDDGHYSENAMPRWQDGKFIHYFEGNTFSFNGQLNCFAAFFKVGKYEYTIKISQSGKNSKSYFINMFTQYGYSRTRLQKDEFEKVLSMRIAVIDAIARQNTVQVETIVSNPSEDFTTSEQIDLLISEILRIISNLSDTEKEQYSHVDKEYLFELIKRRNKSEILRIYNSIYDGKNSKIDIDENKSHKEVRSAIFSESTNLYSKFWKAEHPYGGTNIALTRK